jgi:hypothetical protein
MNRRHFLMSSAAASGSSDIHCGGERKNVDEDDDVRDWRQFPEAVGAALANERGNQPGEISRP